MVTGGGPHFYGRADDFLGRQRRARGTRTPGPKAAVRGEASGSNPMCAPINRPDATGESLQRWSDRRDAWEHGYRSQQSSMAAPSPSVP
jgi:hypothetical protein